MKIITGFIEKHFWAVLVAGILLGLWPMADIDASPIVPKLLLGMMLFLAYLKIDALEIIENMKNFKMMASISFVFMIAIPLLFYFPFRLIDTELAMAILLLTAMPAGVSSPVLTDIAKGNISLSMSLVIATQLLAPFTVPMLFWLVDAGTVSIDKLQIGRASCRERVYSGV